MSDTVVSSKLTPSLDLVNGFSFNSLQQMLEYSFDMYCDDPALCSDEQVLSYYQLDESSTGFAAFLQASLNVENKDIVGISATPSMASAIALCGAFKSGATVALLDPGGINHAQQFFVENRIRLLVAQKDEFFSSRYLQRYLQSGEQVITLDQAGCVEKTSAFSRIVEKTSPDDWIRPDLKDQKRGCILRLNPAGDVYRISRQEFLAQVEELYHQSQNSSGDPEIEKVENFLQLLVQLLRGKSLSCL